MPWSRRTSTRQSVSVGDRALVPKTSGPVTTGKQTWFADSASAGTSACSTTLRLHKKMIRRRRFGAAGVLAIPYSILFEVIGPLLQVAGVIVVIVLLVFDQIASQYATAFFLGISLTGQLQTASSILIEDVGFGRYRVRDLVMIACWGPLEVFWFRPLTAVWGTWATLLFLIGRRPGWGTIPRGAALAEAPVEIVPTPLPR